jgi:hypothetical protein
VDLFNRFGFLQLSFKVLPGVYAGKPEYIFIERSFPVFTPESRIIKLYKSPAATTTLTAAGAARNATGATNTTPNDPSKVPWSHKLLDSLNDWNYFCREFVFTVYITTL